MSPNKRGCALTFSRGIWVVESAARRALCLKAISGLFKVSIANLAASVLKETRSFDRGCSIV